MLRLVLAVLGLTVLYALLLAWYTLRLDAWRGHTLYPSATWEPPNWTRDPRSDPAHADRTR